MPRCLFLLPASSRPAAEPLLPGAAWESYGTGGEPTHWLAVADVTAAGYSAVTQSVPGVQFIGDARPKNREQLTTRGLVPVSVPPSSNPVAVVPPVVVPEPEPAKPAAPVAPKPAAPPKVPDPPAPKASWKDRKKR